MKNNFTKDIKNFFQTKWKEWKCPTPQVHFVLGSLMSPVFESLKPSLLKNWTELGTIDFVKVPHLTSPTNPTHKGQYEYFVHKKTKKSICFQLGRLHGYEGLTPQQVVLTVTGIAKAGIKQFVLSNISGGIKNTKIASVVAIKDHINLTSKSPLVGGYFLNMQNLYNKDLTRQVSQFVKPTCQAVYAGVLGPQLETKAEINMLKTLGADIVGMSTIWEVIALKALKAQVCAFSVVSNMATGIGHTTDINEKSLKPAFSHLIKGFIQFAESL